jgi:riboflavin kinase/FMN adenylyltransferase
MEPFSLIFPYVMKVYYDLKECTETLPHPVVTMGNFDGIHRGHQEIFRLLRQEAEANHGTALVITFHPHPLKVLHPERAPRLITNLQDRVELMGCCGIEHVLCLPFDEEFARWEAERFVREILVQKLGIKKVLVGEDFRFGKNREGGINFLKKRGEPFGYAVQKIEPVRVDGMEISSTRIRQSIQEGRIRESTAMLGRPYNISGTVVTGDKRGRTLGFPTANLATEAELLPPNGIYAVRVVLGEHSRPGVANLGIKPTFTGRRFSIEAHIFEFDQDIYGEFMRMEFVDWIREERSFPDANALAEQIGRDAQQAREILEKAPHEACIRPKEEKTGTLS